MENQFGDTMKNRKKYWWISLFIGLLSILLGILCLITPDVTLVALTVVFTISFLISGLMEISFAFANRNIISGWGFELAGGIIDLVFSIILFILPPMITVSVLIYFVGFWIMFRAIWGIGVAIDIQRIGILGWGWLLALSFLGVLFSVLFIISPTFGSTVIIAFATVSFILYGLFRIYLGITYRSLPYQHT